jgi:hypothetical protein
VRRLQAAPDDGASIAGTPAFDQASAAFEGISVGAPLRLGGPDDDRHVLPLLMRLSRPRDEHLLLMAVIDLERLQALQGLFTPGPPASLVMLRGDGLALARMPEAPGFVGRSLFEQFPAARRELDADEGFFASSWCCPTAWRPSSCRTGASAPPCSSPRPSRRWACCCWRAASSRCSARRGCARPACGPPATPCRWACSAPTRPAASST